MPRCLVLEPALDELRLEVERALPAILAPLGGVERAEVSLDLPAADGAAALLSASAARPAAPADVQRAADALLSASPLARAAEAAVARADRTTRARAGDHRVAYRRGPLERPLELPAYLSPGGFMQASRAGNALLVSRVLEALAPLLAGRPGAAILELFAGNGNFSLPLAAAGARVTSVEGDARAVDNARRAAEEAGLSIDARVAEAALEARRCASERGPGRFDAVLLDPPRTGAAAACEALPATGARTIVYVSCDAVTLARDVASLSAQGFRLHEARPLAIVPQTAHFETIAVLRREGPDRAP